MELRNINTFLHIAELHSFSSAARELGYSQSADEFQGEIFMEGEETDKMFRKENCKARVAYLNGSKALEAPPVELIQFVDSKIHKEQSDLFTTSISEVCFYTDDIDSVYKNSYRKSCGVLV